MGPARTLAPKRTYDEAEILASCLQSRIARKFDIILICLDRWPWYGRPFATVFCDCDRACVRQVGSSFDYGSTETKPSASFQLALGRCID
jgi:hypothetical protein